MIRGGESVCREAGIPIAGGHTIDSVEPIYGLVVMGLVHPDKVRRNADAKAGDVLVLGKPIGVGVLSAALKKDALDAAGYAPPDRDHDAAQHARHRARRRCPACMRSPTSPASASPATRSRWRAAPSSASTIDWSQGAAAATASRRWRRDGFVTGASGRNWAGYGAEVALDPALPRGRARPAHRSADLGRPARQLRPGVGRRGAGRVPRQGFDAAAVVGEVRAGATGLRVRA